MIVVAIVTALLAGVGIGLVVGVGNRWLEDWFDPAAEAPRFVYFGDEETTVIAVDDQQVRFSEEANDWVKADGELMRPYRGSTLEPVG